MTGGKSSRMGGGIKSLKHFNNKSILDKIIERSIKQVSCLAINSNKNTEELKKYLLPIFPDVIKGFQGPLAGIHASLKWTKKNNPSHKWVMTFAGDTPFFPNNLVDRLYNALYDILYNALYNMSYNAVYNTLYSATYNISYNALCNVL